MFYPQYKYRFIRRAIICYYTMCLKRGNDVEVSIEDLFKFVEKMYILYCKNIYEVQEENFNLWK